MAERRISGKMVVHLTGKMTRFLFILAFLFAIASALFFRAGQARAEGEFPDFFIAAEGGEVTAQSNEPGVIRSRLVTLNLEALQPAVNAMADGDAGPSTLFLNLFPDVQYLAELQPGSVDSSGVTTWFGYLPDVPGSSLTLVILEDVIALNLYTPNGHYRVTYVGDGLHEIRQERDGVKPPALPPVKPDPLPQVSASADVGPLGESSDPNGDDTGERIDVMVVYDQAAVTGTPGGETALRVKISGEIANTNLAYANSQVIQRVVLVYTQLVNYDETNFDFSTTLQRLRDGQIAGVQTLRHTYKADLVVMVVHGNGTYCGVGYVMTADFVQDPPKPGWDFAYAAYSLVAEDCLGGFTTAHEMGHNMGASHDWANSGVSGAYLYSHGYHILPANSSTCYYTIMAYACNRTYRYEIPYFSNPNVTYNGLPTGVAGGAQPANNALTFNNTARIVARFRDGPAPTAPAAPGLSINPVTASIRVTWNDSSSEELGYRIERKLSADTVWQQVGSVGVNVTSYTDGTGLVCEQNYDYRVIVYNGNGSSASAPSTVFYSCIPAAPSNLSAVPESLANRINLSWLDNSGNETGFKLERREPGLSDWIKIADLAANSAAYSDTTVGCGRRYEYRIRATNDQGDSAYSNTAAAEVRVCPPPAPASVSASAPSQVRINLSWQDQSTPSDYPRRDETGFEIQRSPNGTSGWVTIFTTAAGATAYSDYPYPQLVCNTRYYYQIRAVNAGGSSGWVSANARTAACAPPPVPAGVTAEPYTIRAVRIRWQDQDNETEYRIERSPNGSSGWVQVGTAPLDSSSYIDQGLVQGETYFYRVRAYNASGNSAYSSVVSSATYLLGIYLPLVR